MAIRLRMEHNYASFIRHGRPRATVGKFTAGKTALPKTGFRQFTAYKMP